MVVDSCKMTNDACAGDGGVHGGDDLTKLCLKCRVEVSATLDGNKAVSIREFGENTIVAAIFELETCTASENCLCSKNVLMANVQVTIGVSTGGREDVW